MPKSNKRKKDKATDFAKAKLKLGKGKQLANNATDTSFKARSIALPHQTIGLAKGASKPTTRRNLTLDDLLLHLKHYNSSTKKESLLGLRELLESHPQLIETSLPLIIQACARTVGDEDADVRRTLFEFLTWLFRHIPISHIMPHAPFLILFITSAQTHIFPAIRIDAVRFLDLLLEYIPETVTSGWTESESTGSRVLEGYLGLLSAGSGFWAAHKEDVPIATTSNITLSPSSKLVVLSSLANFLDAAISTPSSRQIHGIPTWYMASTFSTPAEFHAFCSLIQPNTTSSSEKGHIKWSPDVLGINLEDFSGNFMYEGDSVIEPGFSLEGLGEIGQVVESLASDPTGASNSDINFLHIARLARALHSVLLSTWLDVAPSVFGFGISSSETEINLAVTVGRIAGSLYGAMFRNSNLPTDMRCIAFNDLSALLGYMSMNLPYVSENEQTQPDSLRNLSFAYCELISLAVIESQREGGVNSLRTRASLRSVQNSSLKNQIQRVGDYVVQALDGKLKSSSYPLGYSLAVSLYTTLLPTIWSLLEYQDMSVGGMTSERICTSMLKHAICTPSRSGTKAAATQFVGMIVMLNIRRQSSTKYRPMFTSEEIELVKEWFLQLPKVLWEVGPEDHLLTESILRLLLRVEQCPSTLLDVTTLGSIRSRLIPYFAAVHPQKGKILGPFTKLEQRPHLRRLALNAAFALLQNITSAEGVALKLAVDKGVDGTVDCDYWIKLLLSSSSGPF